MILFERMLKSIELVEAYKKWVAKVVLISLIDFSQYKDF
jgi:hypothetical protein